MSTTTSGWQLRRISGPDREPLTLDEARLALKLDSDLVAEDTQIQDWIVAAREHCEDFCKRTWCESTWLLTLERFPEPDHTTWANDPKIALPMGPAIAIVRVAYLDPQGNQQELTDYQAGLDTVPPWIMPAANQCWPVTHASGSAITVEYRAGYPSGGSPGDASKVPAAVRATMRAILTRWHEQRDQVDIEDLLQAGLYRLRVLT